MRSATSDNNHCFFFLLELIGAVKIIFETIGYGKKRGLFFIAIGFLIQIIVVIIIN